MTAGPERRGQTETAADRSSRAIPSLRPSIVTCPRFRTLNRSATPEARSKYCSTRTIAMFPSSRRSEIPRPICWTTPGWIPSVGSSSSNRFGRVLRPALVTEDPVPPAMVSSRATRQFRFAVYIARAWAASVGAGLRPLPVLSRLRVLLREAAGRVLPLAAACFPEAPKSRVAPLWRTRAGRTAAGRTQPPVHHRAEREPRAVE